MALALSLPAAAEEPKIALETSETLFSIFTALNACGLDQELSVSDPLRAQIRGEVEEAIRQSPQAASARERLCAFVAEKRLPDIGRDLAQYVSLGLNLSPPPFAPAMKEADLPPDAGNVLGLVPLLQQFYDAAGLNRIWARHQPHYEAIIASLHRPVSSMLVDTELYLRLPLSGYVGRSFQVIVEPMGIPGQVNARNYASDYYMVVSPTAAGDIDVGKVRHTYLHYILDPMIMKRANMVQRLDPLLVIAQSAPLEDSYKHDASLLVNESLIRAVEARTLPVQGDRKQQEAARSAKAQEAMEAGFVLTRYFYEALAEFEKQPAGLRDYYGELLRNIDVGAERKRAQSVVFRAQGETEIVRSAPARTRSALDEAEEKLAAGEVDAAYELAKRVLAKQSDDPGRATFILARAATLKKEVESAEMLFEQALQIAREPRVVAWSHIYLGRILDLKGNRDQALAHYRAALAAGDGNPATMAAARRGIENAPPATRVKEEEPEPEDE